MCAPTTSGSRTIWRFEPSAFDRRHGPVDVGVAGDVGEHDAAVGRPGRLRCSCFARPELGDGVALGAVGTDREEVGRFVGVFPEADVVLAEHDEVVGGVPVDPTVLAVLGDRLRRRPAVAAPPDDGDGSAVVVVAGEVVDVQHEGISGWRPAGEAVQSVDEGQLAGHGELTGGDVDDGQHGAGRRALRVAAVADHGDLRPVAGPGRILPVQARRARLGRSPRRRRGCSPVVSVMNTSPSLT